MHDVLSFTEIALHLLCANFALLAYNLVYHIDSRREVKISISVLKNVRKSQTNIINKTKE